MLYCPDQMARWAASLPSRGAWIEIFLLKKVNLPRLVAPLTGSVDRNMVGCSALRAGLSSLPSRGAWIEIVH